MPMKEEECHYVKKKMNNITTKEEEKEMHKNQKAKEALKSVKDSGRNPVSEQS
jgi:hypothetical protein